MESSNNSINTQKLEQNFEKLKQLSQKDLNKENETISFIDYTSIGQENENIITKNRSNTLISYVLQGLGLGYDNQSTQNSINNPNNLNNNDNLHHDTVVMAADLLISNPYKNTTEKFDELKELETRTLASTYSDLENLAESNEFPPTPPSSSSNMTTNPVISSPLPPTPELNRIRSNQVAGLTTIKEENEGQLSQNDFLNDPRKFSVDTQSHKYSADGTFIEVEVNSNQSTPRLNKSDIHPPIDSNFSFDTSLKQNPTDSINQSNSHGLDESYHSQYSTKSQESRSSWEANSVLELASRRYALDMEAKLRNLNLQTHRQSTQIYEMTAEGKVTSFSLTFDILYSNLKKECKSCDSSRFFKHFFDSRDNQRSKSTLSQLTEGEIASPYYQNYLHPSTTNNNESSYNENNMNNTKLFVIRLDICDN